MTTKREFYVYLHCGRDGTPFYVGKGFGRRAMDLNNRSSRHRDFVSLIGRENVRVFIFPCTSEAEAFYDEAMSIKQFRDQGIELANVSSGGSGGYAGVTVTEERRQQLIAQSIGNTHNLGRKQSAEHRAKTVKSLLGNARCRGRKLTSEHKANIGAALRGKTYRKREPLTAERKAHLSAIFSGQKRGPRSEETKEKLRTAALRQWAASRASEMSP